MSKLEDAEYLKELLEACSILSFQKISDLDALLSSKSNLSSLLRSRKRHKIAPIRVGSTMLSLMLIYHSDAKFSRSVLLRKGWKDPVLSMLLDRK